jgi:hypothetical protein
VNRLYNVISSYKVIDFLSVFRRINEGNSIKNIYGTSLVRGNKRLYLTSRLSEVSQSEIWGFFAGKSQIIAVKCPEPKAKVRRTWFER